MKNESRFFTKAKDLFIGVLFLLATAPSISLLAQGRENHQPQQQNRQPQQQRPPQQQQRQPQINQQQRQTQVQQQRSQSSPQFQNRQSNQNRQPNQNQQRQQNATQNRSQIQNQQRAQDRYRPVNNQRPGFQNNRDGGPRGGFSYRQSSWNASRPSYNRQPHVYGGHSYYSYNPYFSHTYRPRVYGSYWHPLGFFIGALATTAILVSLNNSRYYYDQGVYYAPYNSGYQVVAAPIGAYVPRLPSGYANVYVNGYYYYYFAGTFYIRGNNGGFEVTDAPPGAVVYNLPEGCTPVNLGGIDYLTYNDAYYQPIQYNGENAYEVVDVE